MTRFANGFLLAVLLLGSIWYFLDRNAQKNELRAASNMIQEQIQQVGKLIVTEANYSQVFTYKNSQNLFLDMITSDKKALVVTHAKATVEYDLRALEIRLDEKNKTVTLLSIPDPEINIYPEFEYYDVKQDYFNKFEAKDYNKIKNSVTDYFRKKVESSNLRAEAQDRLMEELLNIYILTNSLGWTLVYNEQPITAAEEMERLKQ
ncbi:DUF4230 domain-containing protein [Algoriphagus halophytocola]|uniref:DUF4230 domain-containing protein n=1 Tax=Algoriphagus halophytocola TaxID=2991499 RepID=A0ABY6MJV6_9BACT|nr:MULTISPECIES: DUF4230 domain-containing protein [unclassified Algoriphagus]UZD23458.1 DUF4230 domain-containing protein [Algoriphagus sp. TR-M5]WBL44753.1 DUF4230 domain-containing protein [Algoriphagus sp. TR-M9]